MSPPMRECWRHLANTTEPSVCCGDAVSLSNYFDHLLFVKAKLHYAIWSQTGSKLVANLQLVLDDRPNF